MDPCRVYSAHIFLNNERTKVFLNVTPYGVSYHGSYYLNKEVVDGKVHEAILDLAEQNMTNRVVPCEIQFRNFEITTHFLWKLSKFIHWKKDVTIMLVFEFCFWNMGRKELENFICPLELDRLICERNLPGGAEFSDKLLATVKIEIHIGQEPTVVLEHHVTDALLEHWKTTLPEWISLRGIQSSFTAKTVFEIIKTALDSSRTFYWHLGRIVVNKEDEPYLMELQKLTGVIVDIYNGEYTVEKRTPLISDDFHTYRFDCVLPEEE